ncbi:MAG TPA: hypothetical protein VH325_00345 [Bryobacteraceae bacterium]|jgi:hypothetical protein|nr:hypothetical protein [Bryobacteraceae bacterium]
MKNIYRLAAKDIGLQKFFLPLLFLVEIAGIVILRVQLPKALPGLTLILSAAFALIGNFMICYRFAVAEEKDKVMLFIRTLPVSTLDIVAGKTLVCLGFGSLNVAALLGSYELLRHTQLLAGEPGLSAVWLLYIIGFHWVGIGFFLAVAMIFDAEWAIWVPFPALFLVISAALNFHKIVEYLGIDAVLSSLITSGYPLFGVAVLLTAGQLIVTWMLVRRKQLFV